MDNQIEKLKKQIDYRIFLIEKRRGWGESLYFNIDELEVISKALEMYLDFTNNQDKVAIEMGLTSDKKENKKYGEEKSMTIEEAVKIIKLRAEDFHFGGMEDSVIALNMGVEALEKQISKNVGYEPDEGYFCPACKGNVSFGSYCYACGQKLNWGDDK